MPVPSDSSLETAFRVQRKRRDPRASRAGGRTRLAFTQEEIARAVRSWAAEYGEPPRIIDWEPSRAKRLGQHWRADRFESGQWPTARMVVRQFGSFNAAIKAAGLEPNAAPSRSAANLAGEHAIVDAFIEWTRLYGDVPTQADWDPTRATRLKQEWRINRYYHGDWPSARTVIARFSSFTKAADAAGLIPRQPGSHHELRESEQAANRLRAARSSTRASTPGQAQLVECIRAVVVARKDQDPTAAHAALLDLAGSALAWARLFGSD